MYTLGLPEQPFMEVGMISARARSLVSPTNRAAFSALRDAAARRGCDGVIVLGPNDKLEVGSHEQARSSGQTSLSSGVKIVRGTARGWHGETWSAFQGTCILYL